MRKRILKNNKNKGFTLIEILIAIFIFATVSLLLVSSLSKIEGISSNSANQMMCRKYYNMFVWQFSNSIDSLSSSYEEYSNGKEGIIVKVKNIKNQEKYKTFKTNSDTEFCIKTDNLTIYLTSNRIKQDISIEKKEYQYSSEDNIKKVYGYIKYIENGKNDMFGKNQFILIKKDENKKDKVNNNQTQESYFEIKVSAYDKANNIYKLESIRNIFYVEKSKGFNQLLETVYTCQQEVYVKIEN